MERRRDRVHRRRPDRPAARCRSTTSPTLSACSRRSGSGSATARAGRSAGARAMTLWAGRVGTALAPEVWEFLRASDDELLPYDLQGTLIHEAPHATGLLTTDELAEVERPSPRSPSMTSRPPTRTSTRRSSGCSARSGGRSMRRSRNDQVAAAFRLYVSDASAEAVEDSRVRQFSTAPTRRQRRRCPATRTYSARSRSRSATTYSPGRRCSTRPGASGSPPRRRSRPRSARARWPARRSAPGTPTRCATRSTACRPRLRARLPLRVRRLFTICLGSAWSSCLWTTSEFGFAQLPEEAATGSSMMPQKLNPDVAELARGKAGTAIGGLRPAGDRERPAARLQPRPAGGQATGVRRAARSRGALAALTVLVGARARPRTDGPRPPIPCCARPTRPRRSCAKACRSATPMSRSPPRCEQARSSRRPRPPALRRARRRPRGTRRSASPLVRLTLCDNVSR